MCGVTGPFDILAYGPRATLREAAPPEWVPPMLATLTDKPFSDPGWAFERKFDGERCLAFRSRGELRLRSRSCRPLEGTYPEIADALRDQPLDDFVVDGEVVAFDGARTSFALLQQRSGIKDPEVARMSSVRVFFYVFDLLYAQGRDATRLALLDRKRVLRRALDFRDPVRYTVHRNCDGERYFAQACTHGWEGLIAKETTSAYVPRRSSDWLKLKCSAGQEFVVAGFTEPAGSRIGLGALLVGYYDGQGDLVYAGKVGTGFDRATLVELGRRLKRLESTRPAFTPAPKVGRGVHWARPELVVQVSFTEWTSEGKLRHPRFEGLREDKAAGEVHRENPRGRTVRGQ